jgi:hypothetical protein
MRETTSAISAKKLESLRTILLQESELLAQIRHLIGPSAPAEIREHFSDIHKQAESLGSFVQRILAGGFPVRVALVGEFSSGKSSLLNHLLDQDDLCPKSPNPCTSVVTTFTYGRKECILRHGASGRTTPIKRADYAALVAQGSAKRSRPSTTRVTYLLPVDFLKDVELLDTPGFNNPMNPEDTRTTIGMIQEADAFIYLVDAYQGAISKTGLQQLASIRNSSSEAPIYLMFSKGDSKSPEELVKMSKELLMKTDGLFEKLVLSVSVRKPRSDLAGRSHLLRLFDSLRQDKELISSVSLKRQRSAYQDQRDRIGHELIASTENWHAELVRSARACRAKVPKMHARAKEEVKGAIGKVKQNLVACLRTVAEALEIPNSGTFPWNDDDARIRFWPSKFRTSIERRSGLHAVRSVLDHHMKGLVEVGRTNFQRRLEVSWKRDTAQWINEVSEEGTILMEPLRACCITSLSGRTGAIFNIYELHDQHLRVF